MRTFTVALIGVLLVGPGALAQQVGPFADVPPWHWAYEGIQRAGAAGIFVGYPGPDRDRITNAITQVYDAFAHASHPLAQAWAESFLTNTPGNWPEPIRRRALLSFTLDSFSVQVSGDRATVSYAASLRLRSGAGAVQQRGTVRADAQKGTDGRWRINYTALGAAQPELFR